MAATLAHPSGAAANISGKIARHGSAANRRRTVQGVTRAGSCTWS
jgi:hypothetical protein